MLCTSQLRVAGSGLIALGFDVTSDTFDYQLKAGQHAYPRLAPPEVLGHAEGDGSPGLRDACLVVACADACVG
jgi:hypothetical protein